MVNIVRRGSRKVRKGYVWEFIGKSGKLELEVLTSAEQVRGASEIGITMGRLMTKHR